MKMKRSDREQLHNFTYQLKKKRPLMNFRGGLFIDIFNHIRKLYFIAIKELTSLP